MSRKPALFGLVLVSALSIASSATGFALQVVLAAHFGAGSAIDGYLFAISAPTFVAGLGSAALSYTIVPALVRVERDPGARAALLRHLRRRIGAIAAAFVAIGLPAIFLQELLVPSAAALRDLPALPAMIALGWAIGGTQLFTALFTIELNAARRPVVAALLSLPPSLVAIAVVLAMHGSIVSAPAGILSGSLVAGLLGFVLTRRSFDARGGADASVAEGGIDPGRVCWTLLAMSCFSAYSVIDAFWGPRAGMGTLASLGYAQRLVIGLGGLILAGPSAILTPHFAARLRDSGRLAFLREVVRTILAIGALAATAATILASVASPLIGLAFGRGAFEAADVARVSTIFRSMLPGFCAMLVSVVLTRAIYCLPGVERPMAIVGVGWSVIYFVACGGLLGLGGIGFGISFSLAWTAYLLIASYVLYRYANRAV